VFGFQLINSDASMFVLLVQMLCCTLLLHALMCVCVCMYMCMCVCMQ